MCIKCTKEKKNKEKFIKIFGGDDYHCPRCYTQERREITKTKKKEKKEKGKKEKMWFDYFLILDVNEEIKIKIPKLKETINEQNLKLNDKDTNEDYFDEDTDEDTDEDYFDEDYLEDHSSDEDFKENILIKE